MRNTKDNSEQQKSNDSNIMKRPLTLDLNKKVVNNTQGPSILSTPDVNKFKLESPDLENFMLNTDALQTPTPSGINMFSTQQSITMEQEGFVKGFEDALKNLHESNNEAQQPSKPTATALNPSSTNVTGMSGGGISSYTTDPDLMLQIKEEPQTQTADHDHSMNPIDMESQEKIKLERKRQRNRVAASKCRKRKLERISKLEDRVKILKGENGELGQVLQNLRQHVFDLKQQIIDHHHSGCSISIKN